MTNTAWTHRDVLRLSHPNITDDNLVNWMTGKDFDLDTLPAQTKGYELAKSPGADVPALIREYGLSWEMIPTQALNTPATWDALMDGNVPLGALIRQLPRLTRIGWLAPMNANTALVVTRLTDTVQLEKARIHPLNVLSAMKTYSAGGATYGYSSSARKPQIPYTPVREITDALDAAFYLAFKSVTPANKRTMVGVDVSGSMASYIGDSPLSAAEVAAAMALVTVATEPMVVVYGFSHQIAELPISPRQRLDDVLDLTRDRNFGGTDAALLVRTASAKNILVDTFIVITDNDTWGMRHVYAELEKYRAKTGILAKMIVLACTASEFTVADPRDDLSLDIAGMDSAVPQLIAEFSRGD